jgi:hypothetical protein
LLVLVIILNANLFPRQSRLITKKIIAAALYLPMN